MSFILDKINQPNDIKNIKPQEYSQLAKEIRRFLVMNVSRTGGHLASNLGVVELTMALHLRMDFPSDKLIWDVGHQSYVHKILTGRKDGFSTLRQFGGLSGFPKREESACDAFDTGHSSTSISVANGMAKARDLNGDKRKVVAVIGDGALSGGMAFEALNNISRMKTNLMIVLNDNNMSISENVGGMANYLGRVRTSTNYTALKENIENLLLRFPVVGKPMVDKIRKSKASIKQLFIPGMLFEDMGLTYLGPINGHDLHELLTAFTSAEKVNGPVIVHVITKKGKGYQKAEMEPSRFHGIDPFDLDTGNSLLKKGKSYTDVFGETMLNIAKTNEKLVAITAAMQCGTGLDEFARKYPKRCFDVGIAEEHAVTFAAGLAAGGYRPVVAVYSTFLQRAYDQILHDVCIGQLPVVFAVDRSGIVGSDGETHQGIFDISFLGHIPHLTLLAPKSGEELKAMLHFAVNLGKPCAVKYPKEQVYEGLTETAAIEYGKSELLYDEEEIALLFVGSMAETAVKVRDRLKQEGKKVSLINVRFLSPVDEDMLSYVAERHSVIVTLEENIARGGFGEMAAAFWERKGIKNLRLINVCLPNKYLEHGSKAELRGAYGLDADSITERILAVFTKA